MWRRTTSRRLRACASDFNARWLLDAVTELLAASRRSSEAVLDALARAVRTLDARLDVVLVFRPAGNDLTCVYADGPRGEHFRWLALAREDRRLPAHAARAGCRAVLPADGNALSPTDRFAFAAPMFDGETLLAVAYVSSTERLCASLGDALILAIEHAAAPYAIALEREAERADVRHDALTGLLSPNAFRHVLRDEIARARSRASPARPLPLVRGHRSIQGRQRSFRTSSRRRGASDDGVAAPVAFGSRRRLCRA